MDANKKIVEWGLEAIFLIVFVEKIPKSKNHQG